MYLVIHTSLRSPLILVLLILSLLLVLSILLSDWAEKKRDRKVRELVERSRQRARQGLNPLPAANRAGPPGNAGEPITGFPSRFFRGRFVWLSAICVIVVLIAVLTHKGHHAVRARTVQPAPTAELGFSDTNLPAGAGLDGLLELWYTNAPAQSGLQWPEFGSDHAYGDPEIPPTNSPAQITISPPSGSVVDPDRPSSVDWEVVKSIRPAQSEVPKPPPGMRSLPP